MSKHTPGPWSISRYLDGRAVIIIDHEDFDVARVAYPNRDANARLIAAAPQLVEALDSLIGWAVMRSDWAAAGKSEPTDHPIQRARAALKSAGVSHE